MTNSRILLSALTAGILCSTGFGDSGINWQNDGGWKECSGDACLTTKPNAGIYSATGNANGANVTLDRDHTNVVYGGFAADNTGKNANNNTITIEKGNISGDVYGGNAAGGVQGDANNNTVIIKDGTIEKTVKGGYANGGANENNVIITGGEIKGVINGGHAQNGEANKNKVTISNATISGNQIIVGWSTGGNASENTLIIDNGADITSTNIFVGYGKVQAHNNVLVFKGGNIPSNATLYGGYSNTDSAGNQLIVAQKGLEVKSVNKFQEYFFALPTDINANDTMLTLTDKLTFNSTDKIGVGATGELTNLKKGDSVTLMSNIDGFKADMYDKNLKVKHEDTAKLIDTSYEFDLSQVDSKLNAKLLNEKSKSNEKAKALSEGTAGAAAAVIEAGSVMADKGISQAMNQVNNNANVGNAKIIDNFGAIGFGSNRYQTGSYVDSKSINISVGVALGQEVKYGKVLVGPFIELGYSDYETHNDFSTGHVKGDGISKYLGGGIFARYDWNSYASGHPYVEGSVRFGRNKNSFDSTDLAQSYKSSAFYYGAHLGLGYIVEFENNSNLDFYAKYFYTHLNSDEVSTNQGANLSLDALNSHKTRFGARYNHALNNSSEWQIKPYVGLAWEHEYKGDANARNGGFAVDAPSLEGDSGMAEIGVNIGKEKGLSADLGVAGYAGKRRGVAGNIMVKYEF